MRQRVLVADILLGQQRAEAIFSHAAPGKYKLICTDDFQVATELLSQEFALIIVGLHFAESRMFDFIKIVRADPRHATTPIIAFRQLDSELAEALDISLGISTKTLGACTYINSAHFPHGEMGEIAMLKLFEKCSLTR